MDNQETLKARIETVGSPEDLGTYYLTLECLILPRNSSLFGMSLGIKVNHWATVESVAQALGCTKNRLHQAIVRTKSLRQKPIPISNLDELKDIEWVSDERIYFDGKIYNPLRSYEKAVTDLAARRPFLPASRRFISVFHYFDEPPRRFRII